MLKGRRKAWPKLLAAADQIRAQMAVTPPKASAHFGFGITGEPGGWVLSSRPPKVKALRKVPVQPLFAVSSECKASNSPGCFQDTLLFSFV